MGLEHKREVVYSHEAEAAPLCSAPAAHSAVNRVNADRADVGEQLVAVTSEIEIPCLPRGIMRSGLRHLPTVEDTRRLGKEFGTVLRAGDVVVLDGPLGAGKTAMAGGIAQGLDVKGRVTSPTFVIAREHPSSIPGGVGMLHVDAYRLLGDHVLPRHSASEHSSNQVQSAGAEYLSNPVQSAGTEQPTLAYQASEEDRAQSFRILDELESLDLDSALGTCVLVVEWGSGFVEGLGERVLTVFLKRQPESDVRTASWSWSINRE